VRLLNDRTAYVAVSRARYDALIYTDSTQNLSEALNREINKTTAVEAVQGNGESLNRSTIQETALDDDRELKKDRDKLSQDSLALPQQRPSDHSLNQTPTHPDPAPTKAAEREIEGPEIDLGGLIR